MVSSTPRPHFTPVKDPVHIVQEAGWAPGPGWTGGKSRPHRESIPDRPASSQSLYRLSCPAHQDCTNMLNIWEVEAVEAAMAVAAVPVADSCRRPPTASSASVARSLPFSILCPFPFHCSFTDVTSSDVLTGSNYYISLPYVSLPLSALKRPHHLHPPLSTLYTALFSLIWHREISDLLSNFILLTLFVWGLCYKN